MMWHIRNVLGLRGGDLIDEEDLYPVPRSGRQEEILYQLTCRITRKVDERR